MTQPTPRLPVFDWSTFSGSKESDTPCLITLPTVQFTVSGRAAILLALEMLKIGPGDKVLVPTYHCTTMIAPVSALGAQPVFYPIDHTGAPDLQWIQRQVSTDVRAILVAHFFGLPQPLAAIRKWCDQQGVSLIEDCAHALFGASGERPVGLWGDLAIASLTKFLPVPEGGCLVINRTVLRGPLLRQTSLKLQVKAAYDIIHAGVNHGRLAGVRWLVNGASRLRGLLKLKQVDKPLSHGRVTELPDNLLTIDVDQAHLKLTTASHWMALRIPRGRIVDSRRANYLFFANMLADVPGMHPLRRQLPVHCAPYVFPLWVDRPDPGYAELRRQEFPASRWDRLWPNVPILEGDYGIKLSHHVLQLACHQDLTANELQKMVGILKRIYAQPSPMPQADKVTASTGGL